MAMGQPRAWIVRNERHDQVPTGGQQRHISAWRIAQIVLHRLVAKVTAALRDDEEIVAMEMHRVRHGKVRVHDYVHPFVGVGEGNEIVRCSEGVDSPLDLQDRWFGPIAFETRVVDEPAGELMFVLCQSYSLVDGGYFLRDVLAEIGNELVGVFISAFVGEGVACAGGESRGRAVVKYASDVVRGGICTTRELWDSADPEVRSDAGLISGDDYIVAFALGRVG